MKENLCQRKFRLRQINLRQNSFKLNVNYFPGFQFCSNDVQCACVCLWVFRCSSFSQFNMPSCIAIVSALCRVFACVSVSRLMPRRRSCVWERETKSEKTASNCIPCLFIQFSLTVVDPHVRPRNVLTYGWWKKAYIQPPIHFISLSVFGTVIVCHAVGLVCLMFRGISAWNKIYLNTYRQRERRTLKRKHPTATNRYYVERLFSTVRHLCSKIFENLPRRKHILWHIQNRKRKLFFRFREHCRRLQFSVVLQFGCNGCVCVCAFFPLVCFHSVIFRWRGDENFVHKFSESMHTLTVHRIFYWNPHVPTHGYLLLLLFTRTVLAYDHKNLLDAANSGANKIKLKIWLAMQHIADGQIEGDKIQSFRLVS